jgi:hypothetical protein
MYFTNYHYKKLITFFTDLNKAMPHASIVNEYSAFMNMIAIRLKEEPLLMELLYAIIETICKYKYITPEDYKRVMPPVLFVSRDDIKLSLTLLLILQ